MTALTIEEPGVRGFHFVSWYGLWGPKNLPADISNKLQADIAKVLALPHAKERLDMPGFDSIGTDGGEFAAYTRDELAKHEKIIRDAKMKGGVSTGMGSSPNPKFARLVPDGWS